MPTPPVSVQLGIFVLLFSALSAACKLPSINCGVPCTQEGGEIFRTGFTGTEIGPENNATIAPTGSDPDQPVLGTWKTFTDHPNIGTARINFADGDPAQRTAAIVADPNPLVSDNDVLMFRIFEPHQREGTRMKARVQLDIGGNTCITEVRQSVRLFLDPELDILPQWNEQFGWFLLFEFWNNGDWTGERFPFRVTVNLRKDAPGPVEHLYFNVKGDSKNNCNYCKWQRLWDYTGTDFPVPFGSWMEIELSIREGDSESGRFIMAVTPDGGERHVVFDITGTTQHPDETCPDGFTHLQPLKLYTSGDLVEYVRESGRTVTVYWDDWSFAINDGL